MKTHEMKTHETLFALAYIVAMEHARGAKTNSDQAVRDWINAGGICGWSAAGAPLYRRADGRRVADLEAAIESYV
ncbi:hypothetical protein M0R72_13780 [Candidatus Pacearchaeota archaeon]|nr:hypothetical protein [Candidatus Pacearchaeota archaeon]